MLQAFFHKKINTFLFVPVGNGLVYVREGHKTWYIVIEIYFTISI